MRVSLPDLRQRAGTLVLTGVPLLFFGVCFVYPLWSILALSFRSGWSGLWLVLQDGYIWRVLGFTLWQALLSTLLTLLLGLPGAYVFARYAFPGKAFVRALAGVPFVMPTVVVAAAFAALIGPRGLINLWLQAGLGLEQPPLRLEQSLTLIIFAHAFYNYTIVLRLVGGFWSNLDPRLSQAAAVLGAGRLRAFLTITLPLLFPALGAAALLVFIFSFTSFGVILILGGSRFATLEVEIYRQTAQLLRLDIAAALALIQLGCTFAFSLVYTRLVARSVVSLELQPRSVTARRPRTWLERGVVWGNVLLIVGFLGMPLLALVLRSLLVEHDGVVQWGLAYYRALQENQSGSLFFVPPAAAIGNSLRIAAATTVLALLVGVPTAYAIAGDARRPASGVRMLLDALVMLPLGTSAVTLGLGYLVALSVPGLGGLRTSIWLLPVLHTLVALPFVVRALLPVLRGRQLHLAEAAAMLGAGPLRAWLSVELPIILPALLTGAVFAATVSLGEFGATLLLARPETPTLPVLIFRYLGRPGALNYGQALALSSLLMLITALSFLLLERVRAPNSEF
jgi:thiamine transport system permease protein